MKNPIKQTIIVRALCIIVLLTAFISASVLVVAALDEPPFITVRFAPSPGSFEDTNDYIYTGRFGFRINDFPTPEAPDGYVFVGWFSNGTQITGPVAATRSVTLLAAYAPFQNPYDTTRFAIVYDPGLGQLPEGTSHILAHLYGTPLINLPVPVKNGYSFAGWMWEDELVSTPVIVRGDMILEAAWVPVSDNPRPIPQSSLVEIPALNFVVAFNPFPGTFLGGERGLRFGRGASTVRQIPEEPIRRGAVFVGWELPCGLAFEPTTLMREDVMLTAVWDTDSGLEENHSHIMSSEPRHNPQTSPIRMSIALLCAVVMIVFGMYSIMKLTGKQNTASSKYSSEMMRHIRELRIEIKSKRKR